MLIFVYAFLQHLNIHQGACWCKDISGPSPSKANNLILDITKQQRITEHHWKTLLPWLASHLLFQPYSLSQCISGIFTSKSCFTFVALYSLFLPCYLLISYREINVFPPHISFSNNSLLVTFSNRHLHAFPRCCFSLPLT